MCVSCYGANFLMTVSLIEKGLVNPETAVSAIFGMKFMGMKSIGKEWEIGVSKAPFMVLQVFRNAIKWLIHEKQGSE